MNLYSQFTFGKFYSIGMSENWKSSIERIMPSFLEEPSFLVSQFVKEDTLVNVLREKSHMFVKF